MMKVDRKVILVTRETRLQGLRKKFGTAGQAAFVMQRARRMELDRAVEAAPIGKRAQVARQAEAEAAAPFDMLASEERLYQDVVGDLTSELDLRDLGVPLQRVERSFVPTLTFGPHDVVVCVGQDGLVANVAKYAIGNPIVGVNPDPSQIDGVLLPFNRTQARPAVLAALRDRARLREVTLARATLTDGQSLLAFNDLFVGARSHVSARYKLSIDDARAERQSSSGIIVATGAGSTGWLSSCFNMAAGFARVFGGAPPKSRSAPTWEKRELVFVVREPFASKTSGASVVAGTVSESSELVVESEMPENGVIFSDGVEIDFLQFNAGATARIGVARERASLVQSY